jgi:hypothetical protein
MSFPIPLPTPTIAADTIKATIPYLAAVTTGVTRLTNTPPDVTAKIRVAMQGVQMGVSALAESETAAASKPIVDRIMTDGQAVLQAAAPFAALLPTPYGMIYGLANAVFPFAVGIVHVMVATKTTVPDPNMTPHL